MRLGFWQRKPREGLPELDVDRMADLGAVSLDRDAALPPPPPTWHEVVARRGVIAREPSDPRPPNTTRWRMTEHARLTAPRVSVPETTRRRTRSDPAEGRRRRRALGVAGVLLVVVLGLTSCGSSPYQDGYAVGRNLSAADWAGDVQASCSGAEKFGIIAENGAAWMKGCVAGLTAELHANGQERARTP